MNSGEFLSGALDPIGAILLCLIAAIGLVLWTMNK